MDKRELDGNTGTVRTVKRGRHRGPAMSIMQELRAGKPRRYRVEQPADPRTGRAVRRAV